MKIFVLGVIIATTQFLFAQNQVVGYVYYLGDENSPMEDVDVGLYDTLNTLLYSTQTNEDGLYQFDNLAEGSYVVRSTTNEEPSPVDLQDAHYLLLHLLGMYELGPVQYAAADVDGNKNVSWLDYYIFVVAYLLNDESFPAGDWVFEEHLINLASRSDQDTLSAFTSETGKMETGGGRSLQQVQTLVQPINVSSKYATIEITTNDLQSLAGFNFSLQYPAEMINIESVMGLDENFHYRVEKEKGIISFIWLDQKVDHEIDITDKPLASITFELKNNYVQKGEFKYIPGGNFIGLDGQKTGDVTMVLPELNRELNREISVHTYPNPVSDHLVFLIQQEETSKCEILLFDINGRIVDEINLDLFEGNNEYMLNTERYMPGHYFYVVRFGDTAKSSYSGRMYKSSR